MSPDLLVLLVGIGFIVLLLGGMWVPFAVGIAGVAYIWGLNGWDGLRALGLIGWSSMNSFVLTTVPLFILMSEILQQSGLATRVYQGMSRLVQRLPGGLLQTNIAGCAAFSAVSGSSVATAAAIGAVALPALKERGYDTRMAVGSLAAGGTLGILIPPSIALIVYGTFTETSITKLYIASIIPGLLTTLVFMAYIAWRCWRNPRLAPRERAPRSAAEYWQATKDLAPFALLFALVMGSLYFGLATPSESAAIGCVVSIGIVALYGRLSLGMLRAALRSTVRVTGSVLFIVLAAFIFSYAVSIGGLTRDLSTLVSSLGLSRLQLLLLIVVLFTVLGCLVESMAMIVITVPLLFPVLVAYGVDPIWFGIVLVLLIEGGQISPPFGINLFVIQSMAKGRYEDVVLGTIPYHVLMLGVIALLIAWPEVATWLPAQVSPVR